MQLKMLLSRVVILTSRLVRGRAKWRQFSRIVQFGFLRDSYGCFLVPMAVVNLPFEDLGRSFAPNKWKFIYSESKELCIPKSRPSEFLEELSRVTPVASLIKQVVMPTVKADVAFGLGRLNLSNAEVRSRVSTALDAVGMSEYLQRPVQTLSGGQKQRVAIAGALAEARKVLLLDELTTFLDESDQIGVIKAVQNLLDISGEITALWITHRLEELKYADGALYMEDGSVIAW